MTASMTTTILIRDANLFPFVAPRHDAASGSASLQQKARGNDFGDVSALTEVGRNGAAISHTCLWKLICRQ